MWSPFVNILVSSHVRIPIKKITLATAMRITGGLKKGRRLTSPHKHDLSIRPTSDRIREALFNIIGERVIGSTMLDLFAGTGVVGIEALSRGANQVIFVDKSNDSMEMIGESLRSCFDQPQARIFKLDITHPASMKWLYKKLPSELHFDLVFIDPPYGQDIARQSLALIENSQILAKYPLVIIEERYNQILPDSINSLKLIDQRNYGKTGIWMYQRAGDRGQGTEKITAMIKKYEKQKT